MLIHQLQSQSSGKFSDMKDEIQNLDFFMGNVEDLYIKNSNITKYELKQLLSNELWINSSECLRLGLVDEII
jgi:ATP-dependent protease ClpP protease subunit